MTLGAPIFAIQRHTDDPLVIRCALLLAMMGQRFMVDFGTDNALEKAYAELLPGCELRKLIEARWAERENGAGI